MKDFAKCFYNTKRWQNCRNSYFKKVGGLCERCLKAGKITPGEIVHHKIYLDENNINDASISLNFNNLELLCRECHEKEHKSKEKNKRYIIKSNGEIEINKNIYPIYNIDDINEYKEEIIQLANQEYRGKISPMVISQEEMQELEKENIAIKIRD